MAGTPQLKVYNSQGEYIGCLKHAEDAACICASYGSGATIRYGHKKSDTVWSEGAEDFSAGESYDRVALIIGWRVNAMWAQKDFRISASKIEAEITAPPPIR